MALTRTGKFFRISAWASCLGITYSLWGMATASGATPLVYLFVWLPVYCGLSAVLFIASCCVPKMDSSEESTAGMQRLRLLVDVILGVGCLALLIEAFVIASEGKTTQACELVLFVVVIAAFRGGVRRLPVSVQHRISIGCIVAGALLALFWFPALDLILTTFDVDY